jgi:penicillin-binding protein 1A
VFQSFMEVAVEKFGGTEFAVPPGGYFINIDRYSGARLRDDATGDNVQREYFREGQDETVVFAAAVVDGGFAMGSNLPLFARGESDGAEVSEVTTSTGERKVVPKKADFGTLSSGGLY